MNRATVDFRSALHEDVDALLVIARESFPESLRWRWPRIVGRRWLNGMIQGSSSELWVATHGKVIMGFALLILERDAWQQDVNNSSCGWPINALTALCSPFVLARKWQTRNQQFRFPPVTVDRIVPSTQKSWLELIVTSPSQRYMGVGRHLLRHVEERTIKRGLHAIGLQVETANAQAQCFYEDAGYQPTLSSPTLVTYQKVLIEDSLHS